MKTLEQHMAELHDLKSVINLEATTGFQYATTYKEQYKAFKIWCEIDLYHHMDIGSIRGVNFAGTDLIDTLRYYELSRNETISMMDVLERLSIEEDKIEFMQACMDNDVTSVKWDW